MKNNKKGFTLIEMMVVIAVVAVLISIMIPVLTGNTDKAAAATNAANLRSVEGELISMMLIDPYAFGDQGKKKGDLEEEITLRETGDDALKAARQELKDAQTDLANAKIAAEGISQEDLDASKQKAINAFNFAVSWTGYKFDENYDLNALAQDTSRKGKAIYTAYKTYDSTVAPLFTKQGLLDAVDDAQDAVTEAQNEVTRLESKNNAALDSARDNLANMWYYKAENGVITLKDNDGNVTATIPAPASQKVSTDTLTIEKGVEMIVYVDTINYEAYAFYGDYRNADFAAVAE